MAPRSLLNLDEKASASIFGAKAGGLNISTHIQYIQTEPRPQCKSLAERGTELLNTSSAFPSWGRLPFLHFLYNSNVSVPHQHKDACQAIVIKFTENLVTLCWYFHFMIMRHGQGCERFRWTCFLQQFSGCGVSVRLICSPWCCKSGNYGNYYNYGNLYSMGRRHEHIL